MTNLFTHPVWQIASDWVTLQQRQAGYTNEQLYHVFEFIPHLIDQMDMQGLLKDDVRRSVEPAIERKPKISGKIWV